MNKNRGGGGGGGGEFVNNACICSSICHLQSIFCPMQGKKKEKKKKKKTKKTNQKLA